MHNIKSTKCFWRLRVEINLHKIIEKRKRRKFHHYYKSLRNSKRRNKGNLTSKSNSNKIKLCGSRGKHYLFLNMISAFQFNLLGLLTIFKWIKQYFPRKMLKKICFSCKINLTIGERPNKKYIESLNLTRKANLLRLWRGNTIILQGNISLYVFMYSLMKTKSEKVYLKTIWINYM